MKKIPIEGKKFNRLTVVCEIEKRKNDHNRQFKCVCDCGNFTNAAYHQITRGTKASCGCLKREKMSVIGKSAKTHGLSGSRTHTSWTSMKYRCSNISKKHYHGRGIEVCKRWDKFENFLADMGERPKGKTLDRINSNGNYEPSNCRWATPKQQSNNQTSNRIILCFGKKMNLQEWSDFRGIKMTTIKERLNRGWSTERSLGYV